MSVQMSTAIILHISSRSNFWLCYYQDHTDEEWLLIQLTSSAYLSILSIDRL